MISTIPDDLLSSLSQSVADCFGLHFPRERWSELGKRIASIAAELGYKDAAPFAARFLSDDLTSEEKAVVARRLTVGETYFFRDAQSFEVLERHVLPELIRERRGTTRRLRIWSAGCSSGEEAYSIAVVIRRLLPDLHSWNVLILATDINHQMLRKAARGVYSQWSFRTLSERSRESFCRRNSGGAFEVLPEVKEMVTFAYLNLASNHYPATLNNTAEMDIIFCRNVLMYLVPETVHETVSRFHASLADDGWFLSSAAESSLIDGSRFAPVTLDGAILYRKKECSPQAIVSPSVIQDVSPFSRRSRTPSPRVELSAMDATIGMTDAAPAESKPSPSPAMMEDERASADADLYQAADELYREGHYAEAEESLLRLLGLVPGHPTASGLLCRVYANQGKLDAALAAVENYLQIDPLNPGAHYLKATIFGEMGRTQDARASLSRALYLDPGFVLAHFALGNIALREGRHAQAMKSLENVVALSQGRPREELLPESEGMTAGALLDMVAAIHSNLRDGAAGSTQKPDPRSGRWVME